MRGPILSGLCILAFGAGWGALALAASITTVVQQGRRFSVPELAVARGGVVRFTNEDSFRHQIFVPGPGMSFESDEQAPAQMIDIAFPSVGTFEVRCHIHPKMVMRVDVR